jgi:phenylalanyl-tRNA synthetase beta chain
MYQNMKISYQWLKELVSVPLSPEQLAEKLTMAGFEVEGIEDRRQWAEGVVLGKILTAEKHPNADKLQVCTVDVGAERALQIVCGAPNARAGLLVPVAKVGTYLPHCNLKIRATNLRGVKSEGMICSLAELGLAKESEGIHEFQFTGAIPPLGSDVRPLLDLDDVILEVTSTANRADALSVVGIAREVGALCRQPVRLPLPQSVLAIPQGSWVKIAEPKACPAYIGTVIENVQVGESPPWLKSRLEKAGQRSINNIVDITNYIQLLWGQPLHAFDRDKLGTDLQITVQFSEGNGKLLTLDGVERQLSPQNLLIMANQTPVAIAGVIGGANSEVSDRTTNILLEAALFSSVAVRKSARALGIRTESSARYERGVNQASLETACNLAIEMILSLAGGRVVSQSKADYRQKLERSLPLRLARVWQVLGAVEEGQQAVMLAPRDIEECLTVLGFELHPNNPEAPLEQWSWTVQVPPYRYADIEREIDLIEEIARIYGYDKFVETLPARTELGYLPDDQVWLRQIRSTLRGLGLTEVMHSSLVTPQPQTAGQVIIANPIAHEYSALRSDLLTGLLTAVSYNLAQGNGILNGFEIGRVFGQDEEGVWEADHLGAIFGGNPALHDWQKRTAPMNWFEAKGLLEAFFMAMGVTVEFQPDRRDLRFHPGRTASLWIAGEWLGTFGELHPALRRHCELPDCIYAMELDLDVLFHGMEQRSTPIFQPYSPFPSSDRDIAFFVPTKYPVAEIMRSISRCAGNLLERVTLFDEYRGEGVPPDQRSLAFRLVYRSSDRTLTESEIQEVHQKVRDMLVEKYQASLRS